MPDDKGNTPEFNEFDESDEIQFNPESGDEDDALENLGDELLPSEPTFDEADLADELLPADVNEEDALLEPADDLMPADADALLEPTDDLFPADTDEDATLEMADDMVVPEAGVGEDTFGAGFLAGAEDEAAVQPTVEPDEKEPEEEKPGFLERLTSASPYTVVLGVSLVAILIAMACLLFELKAYNFDLGAKEAKQRLSLAPAAQSAPAKITATA